MPFLMPREVFIPPRVWLPLLILTSSLVAGVARADRRYFLNTYTSYLESAGTLETELWTTAFSGQGDTTGTAWENRIEFEYAVTDRFTSSMYLNFVQAAGAESALRFDGPSLEAIYRFAAPGQVPLDPAAYLEARENGDELELEPKLILSHRGRMWIQAFNIVGEFETQHHASVPNHAVLSLNGGVARDLTGKFALGIEGRYERGLSGLVGRPAAFFAGPSLNLDSGKIELAITWQPQLGGTPASSGNLNLAGFPRSEFWIMLGVDL
jgi:hypothetical protein